MKRLLVILLSLSLVLSLSSCTNNDNKDLTVAPENSNEEKVNENNLEGTDKQEDVSDIKVVATSVAIVEILDALGVEMVGIPTSTYKLPESIQNATKVGNPMSPDMEVIKSLNPTMVFSVVALEPTLKENFEAVNIPSEFVNLSSFEGLIESIKIIGEKTNTQDKAIELVEGIEKRVETSAQNVLEKESSTVMIVFGASGNFQIATEKSYVGDLVKRVGGKNIIDETTSGFIPVDIEYLANENPDYILLMTHANPEESKAAFEKEFSENVVWDNFDAVKNDKVIALDSKYFGMSANLFAADAIEKLEEILYDKE